MMMAAVVELVYFPSHLNVFLRRKEAVGLDCARILTVAFAYMELQSWFVGQTMGFVRWGYTYLVAYECQ